MRILSEAKGYKTQEIATKKIEKAIDVATNSSLTRIVRWVMVVNDKGKFVPTVVMSPNDGVDINYWISSGFAILS